MLSAVYSACSIPVSPQKTSRIIVVTPENKSFCWDSTSVAIPKQPRAKNNEAVFFHPTTLITGRNIFISDALSVTDSLSKLDLIGSLKNNWNGYGAEALAENVINNVRRIVKSLQYQPEIFPISNGKIQLEYDGPRDSYLEFEVGTAEDPILYYQIDKEGKETKSTVTITSSIEELVKRFYE